MHRPQGTATRTLLRILLPLVLLTALLLTGCASKSASDSSNTKDGSTATTFTPGAAGPSGAVDAGRAVGYFCDGEAVVPVRLDARADDVLGGLEALFAGPTPAAKAVGYTSAIPAGSRVLNVDIDAGTATVDVSTEFGSGGGSSSMQLRVAQVVFTLTRDPAVKQVVFKMDGKPVTALGGEGLSLAEPQTRKDWESASPKILVETPVLGDSISGLADVAGTAFVPLGRFKLSLKGADGFTIATVQVSVEGSGTVRASFDESLTITADAGKATITPWYASSADGSRVIPMQVPVVVK